MSRKIIFFTEGGGKIGFGHLSRCTALGQALKSLNPAVEIHYFVNGDKKAAEFLKGQGIKPILSNWHKDKALLSSLSKNSHAVIIDSYLAPASAYREIFGTSPKPKVVAIDDYSRMRYFADAVVNPSIYGDHMTYISQKELKTEYLVGKKYVILRKEFWDVPHRKPKRKLKDALITFGGVNRRRFVKRLLSYLSENAPDLTYHVVADYLKQHDGDGRVKIYRGLSPLKIKSLMSRCDICLSAGGQTLYELARIGVPAVGICFSENQKRNLLGFRQNGLIEYVGWYNETGLFKKIEVALRKASRYQTRVKMVDRARLFFDGKGAKRVAEWILKA